VVITFGVASTADVNFPALKREIAEIAGITDRGGAVYRRKLQQPGDDDFVTIFVTAESETVVRIDARCDDQARLHGVKRLLQAAFDSKEEANSRFGGADIGAVVTSVPLFVGLTPPPPPPPTLTILFGVPNTDALSDETMGELTGTLAERLTPPLEGNLDGRLSAEKLSPTQIIVRITGDGLVYWDLMVTLRSLMPTVEATNALISGFDFTAVPIFGGSGLRYPPPVPPPGLPPLAPARQRANGTETRDSNLTQEETSNIGTPLLVIGILCFIAAAGVAFYLFKTKQFADKEVAEGRMKRFAWFWSKEQKQEDIQAEEAEFTEVERMEQELGRELSLAEREDLEKQAAQKQLEDLAGLTRLSSASTQADPADPDVGSGPQPGEDVVRVPIRKASLSAPFESKTDPQAARMSNLSLEDIEAAPAAQKAAEAQSASSKTMEAAAAAAAALAAAEMVSGPTGGTDSPAKEPYDPYETENDDSKPESGKTSQGDGTGDEEDEEALVRRIAWIEYYVGKGELDKARELGWSGDMSFLGLADDGTPLPASGDGTPLPQSGDYSAADGGSSMHRI
jgi:hypothetical protein